LGTAYVPLAGLIDLDAERARLQKQQDETTAFITSVQKKLANENFVTRAPPEVVARERARLLELEERLGRVREQLASLG
jgi:valyl-tRNA synthetase